MSARYWLAIFLCLLLGLSGCLQTVEKAVPSPAAPPRVELTGPYDGEIPREYRDRLLGVAAADRIVPQVFLAVADHFAAEGDAAKAHHFLSRAAGLFAGNRDFSGEALAFSRRVFLLYDEARGREAFALLREGAERWKVPPLSAFPGYVQGRLALLEGDFIRARETLRKALRDNAEPGGDLSLLRLKRDTELAAGEAAVLADRLPLLLAAYGAAGTARREAQPGGEGSAHLREALAVNGRLRQTAIGPLLSANAHLRSEAEAYAFLGLAAGSQDGGAEALRLLQSAAALADRAGFREVRLWSLLFFGELGIAGRQRREGLSAVERAKELADRYAAAPYRLWARLLTARYYRDDGRIAEAIAALEEADAILTNQGPGAPAGMLARVIQVQRRGLYEMLVVLLAGERRVDDALRAAEKAKARAAADLMADADMGRTPGERELLERHRELCRAIRHLQQRILRISGGQHTAGLLKRLGTAEEAYRGLMGRLEAEDKRLFTLVAARGVDGISVQRLLDGNTTLFDYFVTETSLYVWVIHRTEIHLERIALTREGVRELVLSFLGAIRDKDGRKTEQLSRRTYDLLLKPVISYVSGERIGFITDDCLVYLPFAAMRYRGKFLVEGFTLFQLPGLGLFGQAAATNASPGLRILAFGDPDLEDETRDLPRATEELTLIRKRVERTKVLLREQASEAAAAGLTAPYDVYHFAVRAVFDPVDPLRSGLLLTPGTGQDGTLNIVEITRLRPPERVAMLSGCDTIPEKDPEGRSLVALQRAFLAAGSPAVVSTLWYVQDRAASRLPEFFYRQVERKESLAAALRAGQLRMLREGHPPHLWAAFVLTGTY